LAKRRGRVQPCLKRKAAQNIKGMRLMKKKNGSLGGKPLGECGELEGSRFVVHSEQGNGQTGETRGGTPFRD